MNEIRSLKGTVHIGPRDLPFHLTLGCLTHKAMKNHCQLPRTFPNKQEKKQCCDLHTEVLGSIFKFLM